MTGRRFYITTAIDYVNQKPHLGTAYEKIGADVMARYKRLAGYDVRFLMGNDEHSTNVELHFGLGERKHCRLARMGKSKRCGFQEHMLT